MTDSPDSAPSLLPAPEPESTPDTPQRSRVSHTLKWGLKILFLIFLLCLGSLLAVGCADYNVVSLVGDRQNPKVIRERDIIVSMQTTAELLNSKNPDWRFKKKLEMERINLETMETQFLQEYLAEIGDTERLAAADTELFQWARDARLIRRPKGVQGYRWWMKENKILFLGFL